MARPGFFLHEKMQKKKKIGPKFWTPRRVYPPKYPEKPKNTPTYLRSFEKGLADRGGLARGSPWKARDSFFFSVPFFLCHLRRRGTHFWRVFSTFSTFLGLFGGFVCRQPPPANPFSKPPNTKNDHLRYFFGVFRGSSGLGHLGASWQAGAFSNQDLHFVGNSEVRDWSSQA